MSVPLYEHGEPAGRDRLTHRVGEEVENRLVRLAGAVEACEDAITAQTPDGVIELWNAGAERIYGYSAPEMIGSSADILIPPDLTAASGEMLRRINAGERIERLRTERLRKDGSRVAVSITAASVRDAGGGRAGVVCAAREIPGETRRDETLSEVSAVVELSDDAIIRTGLDGVIRSWNSGAERLYGYTGEEVVGRSILLLLPPDRAEEEAELLRSVREGRRVQLRTRRLRKDGDQLDVSLVASPIPNAAGEVTGACRLERNISELMRLESATAHLAAVVESSEDAIISKNLDGIILTWNDAAERVYGYTAAEVKWRPMSILLPPDRADEENGILDRMRRGERVEHFETVRVRKDGMEVPVSLTISPIRDTSGRIIGASHVARDISDRKAVEAELLQTQKLESLGVLAGGIAHDFNNLLTGILGNTSLALESTSPADPNRRVMRDVLKAAERAANLTRQLLAYAGRGQFVTEAVDLSELVREISNLVHTSISRKVQLRHDLADDLPPIDADAGQLQQVVMNLIINAAEAIGDNSGTVEVRTTAQNVDDAVLRSVWGSNDVAPGRYVMLEVQDNGCGMDEATMSRMFDPFFTTKFTGRGLGLAAVMGIVRSHRGALKVYSAPGQGTIFKLMFPAAGPTRGEFRAPEASPAFRGTETILVVDDEDTVRRAVRNALERNGYTVLAAHDGKEGIELFRNAADQVGLVLLDLTMPVLDGEETLRQLKSIRPDIPILLSSGFNEAEALRRFPGKTLAGFIQKPYTAAQLLSRIRSAVGPAE